MKKSTKTMIGIAALTAIGIASYIISRQKKQNRLSHVADEGYETAHDVLYPHKTQKSGRLQYGPVLPE